MNIDGWKYYNHAAVPTCPPHEIPNLDPVNNGTIWKDGVLLARWTTEWDCGTETEWYYVIKDNPFDISLLKSKRRYEINKGNRNFKVEEINPVNYSDRLYNIAQSAYKTYPSSYRPQISREGFIENVHSWNYYKVYGAFGIEDGELCGYACLKRDGIYIDFTTLKVLPEKEKLGINAAIISYMLMDHDELFHTGGYICDGSRSIQHETAFQDYLEKYFGFRKAYCKLNLRYRPVIGVVVKVTYPLRMHIMKKSGKWIDKIKALLKMEEIQRTFL